MNGLWSLVSLEIKTFLRDRAMFLNIVLMLVLTGIVYPLSDLLPASPLLSPAPVQATCERTGPLLPLDVEIDGVWPEALSIAPLSARKGAPVRIVVSDRFLPRLSVVAQEPGAQIGRIRQCLSESLDEAHRRQLVSLGLRVDPDALSSVQAAPTQTPPLPWPAISIPGMLLAVVSLTLSGSFAIEAVPRRRMSGLLEQLRSTQTREEELVAAWVIAIFGLVVMVLAGSAAVILVIGHMLGKNDEFSYLIHSVPLAMLVSALSIVTSLRAPDVQTASMRWMLVLLAGVAGCALSLTLFERPWLAALVPLGGISLASMGWLGPWAALADVMSLLWSVLLVAYAASALRSEDSSTAGADLVLLRRARGNYLPEVLFLTVMGLSCPIVVSAGAFQGDPFVGMTFGFVSLMLVPALLAPVVLALPRRSLLPLAAPRLPDMLLTLPTAGGMLVAGPLVVSATLVLLPDNDLFAQLAQGLSDLADSPWGLLVIGLYPAVCEEFLYRGVIFSLLLKSGRPWLANVGQALAFASAHLLASRLPWTFFFGLIFGFIRLRTGNLWAGMCLHFVFNITSVLSPQADGLSPWMLLGLLSLGALPLYGRSRGRIVQRDREQGMGS